MGSKNLTKQKGEWKKERASEVRNKEKKSELGKVM